MGLARADDDDGVGIILAGALEEEELSLSNSRSSWKSIFNLGLNPFQSSIKGLSKLDHSDCNIFISYVELHH